MSRRRFVAGASAAVGVGTLPSLAHGKCLPKEKPYEYCAFIKFIQQLSYEELAESLKSIGLDGAEVTVRKGGYIRPESVADELPKLTEVFAKHDLKISVLTTDIVEVGSPNAEAVLKTAASVGVQRYRMGFCRYDLNAPIQSQLELLKPKFKDLASLNREVGISGVYQNHAGGQYLGASFWDLLQVLGDIPVEEIGSIFDIRHAVAEGDGVWQVYYDIIKPHIAALSSKDFRWGLRKAKDKRLSPVNCPLGEGQVDYRKFLKQFQNDFETALVTLHVEYLPDADAKTNLAAIEKDLAFLKKTMGVES
ncbi:Xylose isomerase-like TIM barrel [Mariniblastus fucicola]|uniref:Xylose isomerase-like TIM barrel n=2 Tax=Mariniblastus fucicola TaxID=980251 RepID=A0A5B9PDC2_9BACT|nr:Xylose isomerase-like TIM barrel [Mariniblastus fucicola]